MIQKATINDVKDIHALLSDFASRDQLLPRSLSELYEHLRDYAVCRDSNGQVVGTVALSISWDNLAEIRSLAVQEARQREGIGRMLVEHCLSDAVSLGIFRVFTLTYQLDFFEKLGFRRVDKGVLPHKIWADCVKCPKFPDCDETAMLIELQADTGEFSRVHL